MRKSSAPGSEAARDKWLVQKKHFFGEEVLPQAAKLPGTSDVFKKKRFLRISSAPGSEVARDKWFLQKNIVFEEKIRPGQRSCPGQVACSKIVVFFSGKNLPNRITKNKSNVENKRFFVLIGMHTIEGYGSEMCVAKFGTIQSRFLRKSSAPGSEAARDKWLVQKK